MNSMTSRCCSSSSSRAVYHPDPVAVIVAGRYPRFNGRVPVWATHESRSFRTRFAPAEALVPAGVPATKDPPGPVGAVVRQALSFADIASGETALFDVRGERHDFVVEAFCNQRVVLVMLTEKSATRAPARRLEIRSG